MNTYDKKWLWCQHCRGKKKTLDQLSEETGLSRYQIHRAVMSYRRESGEVVMSKVQLSTMYTVERCSIKAIADRLFCSEDAVRRHLIQYGIPRRPVGNPKMKKQESADSHQ